MDARSNVHIYDGVITAVTTTPSPPDPDVHTYDAVAVNTRDNVKVVGKAPDGRWAEGIAAGDVINWTAAPVFSPCRIVVADGQVFLYDVREKMQFTNCSGGA